jgi:MarR family transcriptional regulator, organic hydroperoxide resistance regulator
MEVGDAFVGLDEQLCFAVYAASHAFTAAYKPLLEPHDLTYPQFLVLLALWESDGRCVKELAERLHLDSGTLTPLLKRMEASGLLRRRRNPRNERLLLVELTEKGQNLRPLVGDVRRTMICALGGKVGPVLKLREQIAKVGDQLRAAPHLKPAA